MSDAAGPLDTHIAATRHGTAVPPPVAAGPARPADVESVRRFAGAALDGIDGVLRGKREAITLAVTCLLANGHLLIEDVPGTGKTSLARALASCLSGTSRRIQFTPDLLPTDITGVSIWDRASNEFRFREGPVFANVVVADEINRASPKTQSALLEVMEEARVTVDGVGYPVPRPFLVVATQNPVDLEGTYRLPEAQLDRFGMRIAIGYPDQAVEEAILTGRAQTAPPAVIAVADPAQVTWMQQVVSRIHVAPEIARYLAQVARTSREHDGLRLGVSTRGSLAAQRAAQAHAAIDGRHYVVPEDVKAVATAVMAHRLVLTPQAEVRGRTAAAILAEVLEQVPVPVPAAAGR